MKTKIVISFILFFTLYSINASRNNNQQNRRNGKKWLKFLPGCGSGEGALSFILGNKNY